jgi:cytochrome c oxidase subunit IV
MTHSPSHSTSKAALIATWIALLLFLFLTWGLAQLDLHRFNAPAALAIAIVKMLLVILFFMQVRYKSSLTWVFAAAGFVWFLIMVDLTLADYASRGAVPGNPMTSWKHDAWPAPTRQPPGPLPASDVSP